MHKVTVNSITFGRRTYPRGTKLTEKEIPAKVLSQLEKSKKVEKIEKK